MRVMSRSVLARAMAWMCKSNHELLRVHPLGEHRRGVSKEYAIQHEKHQVGRAEDAQCVHHQRSMRAQLEHKKGEVAAELKRALEVEQRVNTTITATITTTSLTQPPPTP